ncbi:MerR family transcriptional regulator [Lactobacillus sp. PV034]|uniref:MerR family transcriptional regulator n=1 Tax=Lactobacillus sp. PV034 TaxID=2594495 RepID=UPI002240438C|nr:MerR family transcriptional regulator [Lactobacillus sp. PV034]QNQ81040.1 MerR family transcriptional regulator [Lactobacillus sp. PV034]
MSKREFEELIAPADVAEELKISVATLRKYSLIVEKVTSNRSYYARTKQKSRLYTHKNIDELKAFKKLAKTKDITLQEAARQIFAISDKTEADTKKIKNEVEPQTQLNTSIDAQQVVNLLQMLQQTIASQNEAIQALQAQVTRVEKQNQQLIDQNHRLAQPETDTKKDQEIDPKIAAMPDISGIVSNEQPEEKDQVIEETKAEDIHEEILRKARENQEKRAQQNVHRTLADMQIPQKRHWWEKFFK